MNSQEILRALEAKEISPEDAKKALQKEYSSRLLDDTSLNFQQEEPPVNSTKQLNPDQFGNPLFQTRYRCKWNYFAGSMYRGISSENMVVTMGKANLLSFFGSAGFKAQELERYIQNIQSKLDPDKPYGMCLIANLNNPDEERRQAELFVEYEVPVIEVSAYSAITMPLVYLRIKGLIRQGDKIVFPRRIIAKCSHLEVAKVFLSPPPLDMVQELLKCELITEEEAAVSQSIPMVDDLAIEADSGGHTNQGVSFAIFPAIRALNEKMKQKYQYQEEIMIGCGGGIGTPEAVASAFMLGADFIFTGSINQCTVESGAHNVIKDLLQSISLHDTALSVAGDMFEVGAKVQVVKKNTQFYARANKLHQVFLHYKSIDEIPQMIKKEIETKYFKKTFVDVWNLVCEYKRTTNEEQIKEAEASPRLKMAMIFKWYFAHCARVTHKGDLSEKDNFQVFCGPAMGAFNQWVQGTQYEDWKNRHVDGIAELLMNNASEYIKTKHGMAVNPKNPDFEDNAIAIIGISGKFPNSDTLEDFWNNIAQGRDCISEVPEMRWSMDKYYDPDPKEPGKSYSRWMGFLRDIDKFDPLFFNISPAEAELIDPQQRLFLENAWSCIEDAGINPPSLSDSRTSVFVGCGTNDYGQVLNSQGLNGQGLMGVASSILSARISYLLNLKGPCMSIDTACSSSLVAIAEACNSLILRTSDLALAGGVYAMAGPSMHIMTSKSGMLSPDGRCHTFDNQANGFVPGEGVGVVLLKRLSDAVRDQDPIHGVIRGWGINQDGKTNGITAPSVNSQVALEKEVYERFNIAPDTITLIEAHGTGTKLGDPIEVEALTNSFRSYTDKTDYCALGSVKSNIGHLLTAAGIAGVIKVLLALKQRMLPPTIHFKSLNEHILLENSPFYVNTELKSWEVAEGVPRRAGVSSFGFSGTNAHLIIEEYVSDSQVVTTPVLVNKDNPTLFVLSAKNEKQLKIYATLIKRFVESKSDINLADLTYTLQVGRCALDYRLAFVVDSKDILIQKLGEFIAGNLPVGVFTSQSKTGKDVVKVFEVDADAKISLKSLVEKKKLKEIAELWVKGLKVDWDKFYTGTKARRINIPTYPFAKERYWVPDNKIQISVNKAEDKFENMVALHPLLHQNTSDLIEQRFTSIFANQEFFLSDHVVKGKCTLPGVAYLEMARAAVEQAARNLQDGRTGIRLKNVVWAYPIVVGNQSIQVHIGLFPEKNGEISYEIYSESATSDTDSVIHSQGRVVLTAVGEPAVLDLKNLRIQCNHREVSASECYEIFRSTGLNYGPAHQGIERLYIGDGQVLAKLSLPSIVADTQGQFVLHPSLMDSALQ
ncbi:PfaD family polyunsaturated fatty acid/polyketide biosynthesis protein, partial [Priestia megaterium]|uniref:PfaD family polyunsaturated fatty acid/polyketide biosynthesis protein n=1 Tax=Priestia megaterium TaxID=1404 RepID=UPI0012D8E128